jgi:hypothetical protein
MKELYGKGLTNHTDLESCAVGKTGRISKMWMNPPNVPDVATATIHRASKITKIVTSISFLYSPLFSWQARSRGGQAEAGGLDLRNGAVAVLRNQIVDESGGHICSLVHTFESFFCSHLVAPGTRREKSDCRHQSEQNWSLSACGVKVTVF